MPQSKPSVLEICAGAGGQALGLEQAGFSHAVAVEIDVDAAQTLKINRPNWDVVCDDVRSFSAAPYEGVDLVAGGVPCPPFSTAGKQLGRADERDLFPEALRIVQQARPSMVMLENVKGLSTARFDSYRAEILRRLRELGYEADWKLLFSSDYGVPQLRPRFLLVAWREDLPGEFRWPEPTGKPPLVGEVLYEAMAEHGWPGANAWARRASDIAPTLVGGSKKHGGADLGPTRAKAAWLELGVDGKGIADLPPSEEHGLDHIPRLTNRMAALIQGFPPDWKFAGRKTSVYRQIGNAFPPPVARAIGEQLIRFLVPDSVAESA